MIKEIYRQNREVAIQLIHDEEIEKKEIESLYELFLEKDNELIFALYNFFNKNPSYLNIEKLANITNVPTYVLHKVFTEKPVKVLFPIVNNEKGEIATAYVFKLDRKTPKSSFLEYKELFRIKKLLETFDAGKDFFVIFDKNFSGNSYLLSLVAGLLLPENSLKGFAFSGEVNEEGEIYPVGYMHQKEKICKDNNLKLISFKDISYVDELLYYLGEKPIDIPFINLANKPLEEAYISLEKLERKIKDYIKFYSLEKLEKFFNIKKEDIILNIGYLTPPEDNTNQWIETIKIFEEKLKKIYSKIKTKPRVLHFVGSISTLALGFGVKFGTKKPVCIYHYQADNYHKVLNLSNEEEIRNIKQIKEDIRFIKIETLKENLDTSEVAIALWIASHNLFGDVLKFSENKNWKVIGIKLSENLGNLPLPNEKDNQNLWEEIVREIYTVINLLKNEKISKIHLFLSSPVAISFALGMALGHYVNISVYNKSNDPDNPYFEVFNIEDKNMYSIF